MRSRVGIGRMLVLRGWGHRPARGVVSRTEHEMIRGCKMRKDFFYFFVEIQLSGSFTSLYSNA